jgi:multidrug resistance efflux pump
LGDLLAEIDLRSLIARVEQERADIKQLQAQVALAEVEFQRNERLVQALAISRSVYDQSKTRIATTKAQLDQAKGAIS